MRRLLGRQVSVGGLAEFLLWLAIPYLVIGLAWTFFHPQQVQLIEAELLTALPAGANLVAFGEVTLLWPLLLAGGDVCVAAPVG